MEKSLQTVHFHSSDSRFCGSKKQGRQFTFDVNEVTCEKCADQIGLVLTEQGRQAVMEIECESIARKGGFTMNEKGSVVPVNPDEEGFWEDWQSCCEANGLVPRG